MKKLASLAIIFMVLSISISVLINMISSDSISDAMLSPEDFENAVSENLPFRDSISDLMGRIQYFSGVRHFGNIYIGSEGSLLLDIEPPTSRIYSAAKNYIIGYAEKNQIKPYFMLVPTAAVILQQEIDDYATEEIYNQRIMINQMYSLFEGELRTTDVYQTLFDHRNEYIYYHTEDIPTSLGGYYIYSELCNRLDIPMNSMESFSAAYMAHGFYGSLADEFFRPYSASDFITFYEYTGEKCTFTVNHIYEGSETSSDSLFVYDESKVFDETDMILGEHSPITEITRTESSSASGSLLVFGDESAKSWIPFIASNYLRVTFVDLDLASPEMLENISTAEYNHVLFAYSTGKFSSGINFENLEYVGY